MFQQLVFLVILIAFSAFFSAIETAFYSVDRFKVERFLKKKVPNAVELKEVKDHRSKFLSTILVLNNVVNIAAASISTTIVLGIFPGDLGIAVSTFLMTFLILIFGEISPKKFASKHAAPIALFFSPVVLLLMKVLSPITLVLEKITGGISGSMDGEKLTEEEVRMIVSLGLKEGAIDKDEKEMIHNVFRLDDVSVEEIMTPKVDMIALEKNKKLNQLKKFLKDNPYSKIPVYDETIDNVVGIFNVRKVMGYLGKKLDVRVSELMEEALFVPKSKKIGDLLREFQEKKVHIAIVVGEYGGVQGVVTLEDVLEELVGEIEEKKDDEYEMKVVDNENLFVEGGKELSVVNEEMSIDLKSKNFKTVAGFIIEKIDRIPKTGEKFSFNGVKFEILSATKTKIEMVKISK